MSTEEITLHEEHQRAARKHALWLREIEEWKADHKRALVTLAQAEAFVREHDALLAHHAEAILEHEAKMQESGVEFGGGDESTADSASHAQHDELEQLHQRVLEQHNRFRGRHPALMNEITRLAVELHKVSHQPG